jgi:type III secretion system YscQ/HrcQ family protein
MKMHEGAEIAERASFTRLEPAAVALGNWLVSCNPRFTATIMGADRQIALSMQTVSPAEPGMMFGCRVAGFDSVVSMDDEQTHRVLSGLAAGVRLRELPETLVMAIAQTALGPVLEGLARHLRLTVSLDGVCENEPAQWPVLLFRENESQTGANFAALFMPPAALDAVLARSHESMSASRWEGAEEIPVKVEAEIWSTLLPVGDIADLRCGDVILMPAGCSADRVKLFAGDERQLLGTARRDGCSITIEELKGKVMTAQDDAAGAHAMAPGGDGDLVEAAHEPSVAENEELEGEVEEEELEEEEFEEEELESEELEEAALKDETPDGRKSEQLQPEEPAIAHEGSIDVDGLKLLVGFSLGAKMLNVSELRTLGPGYVFSLDNEENAEVSIVAGGREIGRGEIVRIAERMGIRIVRLHGDRDG